MKLFKSKPSTPKYEGPLFGYRYRVTCAFLEWKLTLDTFTNRPPVVTYQWIKGSRNIHTSIVLENSIRRMCKAHGIPITVQIGEAFPEWTGEPAEEPGLEYSTTGKLLAEFDPQLPDAFYS